MKLLVTDFDGTLYTDDYNKNIEALNKFKQKGNKIVIATGRYLSSLKEDLDKRIDYDYLICTDGSIIYDNNDDVIYKELLDKESCEYVINQLRKLEEVNNIYCLNGDKLLDYDEYDNTNAIIASFEDRKVVEEYFENILKENDEVILSKSEHASNILPWYILSLKKKIQFYHHNKLNL